MEHLSQVAADIINMSLWANSLPPCAPTEQQAWIGGVFGPTFLLTVGPPSSRTAALCSDSLQISYRGVQNAISRRQGCLFRVTRSHKHNFHALAKTNPPLMAYRHRDLICFIYFLVEGTTSAHANTKDEQADTDNRSDFSGAFPLPLFPS